MMKYPYLSVQCQWETSRWRNQQHGTCAVNSRNLSETFICTLWLTSNSKDRLCTTCWEDRLSLLPKSGARNKSWGQRRGRRTRWGVGRLFCSSWHPATAKKKKKSEWMSVDRFLKGIQITTWPVNKGQELIWNSECKNVGQNSLSNFGWEKFGIHPVRSNFTMGNWRIDPWRLQSRIWRKKVLELSEQYHR
jgi:hypothetical protein